MVPWQLAGGPRHPRDDQRQRHLGATAPKRQQAQPMRHRRQMLVRQRSGDADSALASQPTVTSALGPNDV
jgi:hypothetical protein